MQFGLLISFDIYEANGDCDDSDDNEDEQTDDHSKSTLFSYFD